MTSKALTISLEKLAHFQCPHCQKWWSVGDAPLDRESWWCPWCGKQSQVDVESFDGDFRIPSLVGKQLKPTPKAIEYLKSLSDE